QVPNKPSTADLRPADHVDFIEAGHRFRLNPHLGEGAVSAADPPLDPTPIRAVSSTGEGAEKPGEGTLVELSFESAGRYLLRGQLGHGSMGEVWCAEDPDIGRLVAVKLLNVPQGLTADETSEWQQRFLREARAAGRLSHPGIISIHDVGKT